jgi:hypothetical protein
MAVAAPVHSWLRIGISPARARLCPELGDGQTPAVVDDGLGLESREKRVAAVPERHAAVGAMELEHPNRREQRKKRRPGVERNTLGRFVSPHRAGHGSKLARTVGAFTGVFRHVGRPVVLQARSALVPSRFTAGMDGNPRQFELANVVAWNATIIRQAFQSARGFSWIRRLKPRSTSSSNKMDLIPELAGAGVAFVGDNSCTVLRGPRHSSGLKTYVALQEDDTPGPREDPPNPPSVLNCIGAGAA